MKVVVDILEGKTFRLGLVVFIAVVFSGFMQGRAGVRPDMVSLRDAGSLSGHFAGREGSVVLFITVDAEVRLPEQRILSLDCSAEGESELYLGKELLERQNWDGAEHWFRIAAQIPAWKSAAEDALAEVEAGRQREREERQKAKRGFLAALIDQGQYKEGLQVIERWSAKGEEDLWAGERARIHLILARNAVDHLEYRTARYHLEQARRAGMSGREWQELWDEVEYWHRMGYAKVPGTTVTPFPRGLFSQVQRAVESLNGNADEGLILLAHREATAAGVDPFLVCAVIQAESNWDPNARSPKGAMGLMQLMPMTAREMGISNPMDPVENVKGGVRYLRGLLDLYKDTAADENKNLELALGAYNAGPARIAKYHGLPPFKETREYVRRVTELFRRMRSFASAGAPS